MKEMCDTSLDLIEQMSHFKIVFNNCRSVHLHINIRNDHGFSIDPREDDGTIGRLINHTRKPGTNLQVHFAVRTMELLVV